MSTFYIEEYFNSLSIDVEEIDVSYKNIYNLPDLSKFTKLK